MPALSAIWAEIDADRLTELLVRAVDRYSPSYAEEPAMRVFARALGDAGIPYARQRVAGPRAGERANLLVEIGPEPAQLLWVGHVDTIPYLDEEAQATRREGDLLYGLGTADMKGACAAMVEALIAVTHAGVALERGLAVGLVVGEEESGDGSGRLLERVSAPLTVIGEPTGLEPCLSHYGYFAYRLAARGAEAHAALPEAGASAIHAMLAWLMYLMEERGRPPFADNVSINPREITGGADLFVVARRCEADIDVHAAPGFGADDVARLIEAARARALLSHPRCALACEPTFAADGYALSPDDQALGPLRRAYRHMEMDWGPGDFPSHSDAILFYEKGSRPVICGPGRLEAAHTRREHVSLSEVERAARLYAALIFEACVA